MKHKIEGYRSDRFLRNFARFELCLPLIIVLFIPKGDVRRIGTSVKFKSLFDENGRNENICQKCKQTSDSGKTIKFQFLSYF